MESIIIYTSLILSIITITTLYFYMLGEGNRKEKIIYKENKRDYREYKEPSEERKELYLQLANLTTGEILQFKNKNEFIRSIQGYDTIKHFLKGTERENQDQLINWYYPGYKKL